MAFRVRFGEFHMGKTARQAALSYYSGSNTLPPDCTKLVPPCSLGPLVNGAHLLDSLGVNVVYANSATLIAAPATSVRGNGPFR